LYTIVFTILQVFPEKMKNFIINGQKKGLEIDPHFIPNPLWEQRFFCIAPNGDFFRAIREASSGSYRSYNRFYKQRNYLKIRKTLEADNIITATGLDLVCFEV
jgi:hypothetical protein